MSQTMREAVVPLPPKALPAPPMVPAAALPLDAIREAVRAEMNVALAGVQQVATETALRAAAAGVAGAKLAGAAGALRAVAQLLAVRGLLFLALCGGFGLAWRALDIGTYQAGGVVIAYAILILIPLIWLERNPRVEKPQV